MSPQGLAIYRLLQTGSPMTAQQIGERLGIFPHTVYRAAKVLKSYGWITHSKRPMSFAPVPFDLAFSNYMSHERAGLIKTLGVVQTGNKWSNQSVVFIQSRDEWLSRSSGDLQRARSDVCLIVSGHEVPAEVIYEHKEATDRGVIVKMLIQEGSHIDSRMIDTWHRIGMDVRLSATINVRLNVYDGRIAYLMSYDPKDYKQAVGVRFTYPPIASLLHELFLKHWSKAQPIAPKTQWTVSKKLSLAGNRWKNCCSSPSPSSWAVRSETS